MITISKAIDINNFIDGNDVLYQRYDHVKENETSERIKSIISITIEDILVSLLIRGCNYELYQTDFPLMSNFDNATKKIVETLDTFENVGIGFARLGSLLRETDGSELANTKYGESHAKVAEILGLVTIDNTSRKRIVYITNLGYYFLTHIDERGKLITRLLLRSRAIGLIISKACIGKFEVNECMRVFPSAKTLNRRLSVVKALIQQLQKNEEYDFTPIIENLTFTYMEV